MEEFSQWFKRRTKRFSLGVIELVQRVPSTPVNNVLCKQVIRSSTSIGANYRAACRAKSTADFINKLKMAEEEADETMYWLEIMAESGSIESQAVLPLLQEANNILAIVVSSIKTTRSSHTS